MFGLSPLYAGAHKQGARLGRARRGRRVLCGGARDGNAPGRPHRDRRADIIVLFGRLHWICEGP